MRLLTETEDSYCAHPVSQARGKSSGMALVSNRFLFALLAILCGLGLVGCGSRTQGEKILRLGVLGPFTGPAARTGEEFRGAAELAFEAVDYRIGDYKVELTWIDEQSDPQKASSAYEEAIMRKGIETAIFNWHSTVAVTVMEMAAKYRIPHFIGMGATEVVNDKYALNVRLSG